MSTSTVPTLEQYVASVSSTIPSSYEISKADRCYLPVSLGTKPFQRPMLDAAVDWISEHLSHCAVLVCDSIHRLTLQITRNLSPEDARAEALRLGEIFIEENLGLFNGLIPGRFEFFKSSAIEMKQPECAAYRTVLQSMFETNEGFRDSINSSAAAYVDRRFKDKDLASISMTRAEMIELSHKYLIEEMALFATIAGMGWTVDVYPGEELLTLIEIAEGQYPGVPEPLTRRKNVALKLKRATAHKPRKDN